MLRTMVRIGGMVVLAALVAAPASAQIVQALHISAGAFIPRGYSGRADQDVLVKDLDSLDFTRCQSEDFQSCIHVFDGGQISGEWLVAFGNHIELGAGVGFYSRTTPSAYLDYGKPDGSDITQDLSLRIVPVSGVVRFLAGRPGQIQPYVGVGVAALNYRYSESGEFIDFSDLSANPLPTYSTRYTAKGTAVGPLMLAGLRVPVNGDIWALTLEWRHQWGVGKTGGPSAGFLDNKIDLGGDNVNFGVLVRF